MFFPPHSNNEGVNALSRSVVVSDVHYDLHYLMRLASHIGCWWILDWIGLDWIGLD